jgi:CRISPR/Cas system-associated exonuclease Cas4 (RecB family)
MYKSLHDTYAQLDLLPKVVDDLTDLAYKIVLQDQFEQDTNRSPHGHPWHTSFHASQFPTEIDKACPRKAVYQLANFSPLSPPDRWLVGLGEVGKAIEVALVQKWHDLGVLLSPPPTEPIQLGARDKDSWLTTSFDSILLPLDWNRPLPVEVKSKSIEKVREMILANRQPDPEHVAQLKVQLYFLAKNQKKWYPNLDPVTHGVIYYVARDDPKVTKEFNIPLDMEFVEERMELLKEWQELFLNEEIKQTQKKSHPLGWKWSEPPCKWCPFKKHICKPDWQEGITDLNESRGITWTTELREHYSYGESRETVIDRWREREASTKKVSKNNNRNSG